MSLPLWLKDSTIIVTIITVLGGLLGTLITTLVAHNDNANTKRFDEIISSLKKSSKKIRLIDDTTNEIRTIVEDTKDGTLKTLRYRLFHDLKIEINLGETTLENYRELSILYDSYKRLGGNGEIEALYKKYCKLPIKEDL